MGKPKDMEEARILAKGGATALVSGALALCQYLAGDYAAVFALGAANAILPTATDYGTRALSPYERRRVDHVAILMLKEIKSHLDRRHEPRADGFLNIDPSIPVQPKSYVRAFWKYPARSTRKISFRT
jgi:hypothetical protein